MIGVILIFGVPILLTVAVIGIFKKIKQNYKVNKAIKELGGQDPLDVIFENDNLLDQQERAYFQQSIKEENAEHKSKGFFGKMGDFFFGETKESSRIVREVYKHKKESIKAEKFNNDIGKLGNLLDEEELSRAKSAYRILKSQKGREEYAKALSEKNVTTAENDNEDNNSTDLKHFSKSNKVDFSEPMTLWQGLIAFFGDKSNKQYMPSEIYEKHSSYAR